MADRRFYCVDSFSDVKGNSATYGEKLSAPPRGIIVVKSEVGRPQTGLSPPRSPQGLLLLAVPRRHNTASVPSHLFIVFEYLLCQSIHLVNLHVRRDDS